MTESQKIVKANWQTPGVFRDSYGKGWHAINLFPGIQLLGDTGHKSKALAWQAAYDFTIARLESIRQIEEEIRELGWWKDSCADMAIAHMKQGNDPESNQYIMPAIRHARTISRLEVIRDDLRKGMRA